MKQIIFTKTPAYIDYIEGEEWRVATGYEYYMVSNYGRVYSLKQDKILQYNIVSKRYLEVKLKKLDGSFEHVKVHRLVARIFNSNPENKPIVHHIDCNSFNNKADNLMWVTADEHKEIHRQMKKLTTEKGGRA